MRPRRESRSEYLKSYLFLRNSGTEKTTVARVMAKILHNVGVLSQDKLKTCNVLNLQTDYAGQIKSKVQDIMAEAKGGVLFIDEAYNLGGSF